MNLYNIFDYWKHPEIIRFILKRSCNIVKIIIKSEDISKTVLKKNENYWLFWEFSKLKRGDNCTIYQYIFVEKVYLEKVFDKQWIHSKRKKHPHCFLSYSGKSDFLPLNFDKFVKLWRHITLLPMHRLLWNLVCKLMMHSSILFVLWLIQNKL